MQDLEKSFPRQQNSELDKLLEEYEGLIQTFEQLSDFQEKGSLINEIDISYQKANAMISKETLLSRRKRLKTLHARFEASQQEFLREFDFVQLVEWAKKLRITVALMKQRNSGTEFTDQIVQGNKYSLEINKILQSHYNEQQTQKKQKIILDSYQLVQKFDEECKKTHAQSIDFVAIDNRQTMDIEQEKQNQLVQQNEQVNEKKLSPPVAVMIEEQKWENASLPLSKQSSKNSDQQLQYSLGAQQRIPYENNCIMAPPPARSKQVSIVGSQKDYKVDKPKPKLTGLSQFWAIISQVLSPCTGSPIDDEPLRGNDMQKRNR